jgi:hypothetical protein
MYAITATITTTTDDTWSATRQIPTFYLDESVQGILSEASAERVARRILTCEGTTLIGAEIHVTAVKL